jgi:hypothetical protein
MTTISTLREQLMAALDTLSDERVAHLLRTTIYWRDGEDAAINADLSNAKARLIQVIAQMEREDVETHLSTIRTWHEAEEQIKRYDPAKDRMLNGVFEGSPDLSSRVREILAQGFGRNKSLEEQA